MGIDHVLSPPLAVWPLARASRPQPAPRFAEPLRFAQGQAARCSPRKDVANQNNKEKQTSVAAKPLLRPPTTLKRCSVTCAGLLVVAVARGRSYLAAARYSLSEISLQLRVDFVYTSLSGDFLTSATAPAAHLLHSTTHLAGLEPRA